MRIKIKNLAIMAFAVITMIFMSLSTVYAEEFVPDEPDQGIVETAPVETE